MKQIKQNRKKILVVDDEPIIGNICQEFLTDNGFSVEVAPNGDIAQSKLEKEEFDLCLLDVKMPVMDGAQLYRYIQHSNPAFVNKVIFMTGDVLSDNIAEFLIKANRPHLAKPFTLDDLKAIVNEVMTTPTVTSKSNLI
ncbi:MAG: response regulator [Candidatus Tectomicrobia bacterium]|uniref:Response regulator n=1 Tax=Tectimicrobiota bacterium TaxID=2528274 RepID=A0A933GMT7_UNCTE|nr:response regulator [Candidatus Tectomicrobia bacterium]